MTAAAADPSRRRVVAEQCDDNLLQERHWSPPLHPLNAQRYGALELAVK